MEDIPRNITNITKDMSLRIDQKPTSTSITPQYITGKEGVSL